MRRILFLVFFMAASVTLAKSGKIPDGPAPPSLAEILKNNASSSGNQMEKAQTSAADSDRPTAIDDASPANPEIRVIRKADAVMEEYRFNNQLYMVKVTPKIGKPYYIYDDEGNGTITRRDDAHMHAVPPRWTLFSW